MLAREVHGAASRRRRRARGRSAPGWRSIMAFQIVRASSYPASPGRTTWPETAARRMSIAAAGDVGDAAVEPQDFDCHALYPPLQAPRLGEQRSKQTSIAPEWAPVSFPWAGGATIARFRTARYRAGPCIAGRSRGGCGGRGEGRRWPRSTISCSRSPLLLSRRARARGGRGAPGGEHRLQAGAAPAHPCRGRHAGGEGPASFEAEVPAAGARPAGARQGMPINLQPRHWPTNPMPASAAIVTRRTPAGCPRDWCTVSCVRSGPRSATSPRTRRCARCWRPQALTRGSPTAGC